MAVPIGTIAMLHGSLALWSLSVIAASLAAYAAGYFGCFSIYRRTFEPDSPGSQEPTFRMWSGLAFLVLSLFALAASIHPANPEKISHPGLDRSDSRR